ncbi:MAG: DUF6504 family protein [Anaerolineales bacterium]
MSLKPIRFIGENVEVQFDAPPAFEKAPPCPNGFTCEGVQYRVIELLEEWPNYERKGRMARNMRPEHARRAAVKGSWGVGRYYFRVRVIGPQSSTPDGQFFELYYDRAPLDADSRKGSWVLTSELRET